MNSRNLTFGPFLLDAETGTLFRQGAPVSLGYRGLLLLKSLLERPGDVVAKAALMDAVWPGMAIEEGNLSVQIAALRKALGTMPGGTDWIATVPRIGYRFAGAVKYRDTPVVVPAREYGGQESELGPSLAVLPFVNLSDSPEQQYFADGLAEDIITRLSRFRWLFVAARNSSFAYDAKAADVKKAGRELGVRYILTGSARRAGQRLRITTQLVDAAAGAQVWAERYDAELADFFALQDEIAASVIAAIEPQLYAAERQRLSARPPESLDAWGYVMQAMPYVWTWGSQGEIEKAQALLRKATVIDPHYARANSLLAWTVAASGHLGWAEPADVLAAARTLARQAVQRDPDDAWTHFAAGYVEMVNRNLSSAVEGMSSALELNPSLAFAQVILGSSYAYGGMVEDGLHHIALASRLSPRDSTLVPAIQSVAGLCHLLGRKFDEAVVFERKAVQLRPHFGTAWRTLAAAAGLAGEKVTAAEALAQSRRLQPSLSVDWIERYHPIVHQADRAMYIDGLRAAGLN